MNPIEEYNQLVRELLVQLNASIKLSKITAEKLEKVMSGYKLIKDQNDNE